MRTRWLFDVECQSVLFRSIQVRSERLAAGILGLNDALVGERAMRRYERAPTSNVQVYARRGRACRCGHNAMRPSPAIQDQHDKGVEAAPINVVLRSTSRLQIELPIQAIDQHNTTSLVIVYRVIPWSAYLETEYNCTVSLVADTNIKIPKILPILFTVSACRKSLKKHPILALPITPPI